MKINKRQTINVVVLMLVSIFSLTIGATAATTIAASQVTYNGTTVKAKIDELVEITNRKCAPGYLCEKAKIGDYVSMTPTSTSYTISAMQTGYSAVQTINPSELNLWRVIDVRSDGTIEMVSEYASSQKVYLAGKNGFVKLVETLNLIAKQYENSNYTISSRHIGYYGQTPKITDTSKITTTAPWTTNTSDNSNETVGGGDTMYEYDVNESTGLVYKAIGERYATNPSGTRITYWLASREYQYKDSTTYHFMGRVIGEYGTVLDYIGIYSYNGSNWNSIKRASAIRPIVTLRADITSYSGDGTSASPWVLS